MTTDQIFILTCDALNIDVYQAMKKCRKREYTEARQLAMYFGKKLTKDSLSKIAWTIGHKEHATVLHAIKKVHNLRDTNDKEFIIKYKKVKKELGL